MKSHKVSNITFISTTIYKHCFIVTVGIMSRSLSPPAKQLKIRYYIVLKSSCT